MVDIEERISAERLSALSEGLLDEKSTSNLDVLQFIENSEIFNSYLNDLSRYRNWMIFRILFPVTALLSVSCVDFEAGFIAWSGGMFLLTCLSCVSFSPDFPGFRNDPPLYPVSDEVRSIDEPSQATTAAYRHANLIYNQLFFIKYFVFPAAYMASAILSWDDKGIVCLLCLFNCLYDLICVNKTPLGFLFCNSEAVLKFGLPKSPDNYEGYLKSQRDSQGDTNITNNQEDQLSNHGFFSVTSKLVKTLNPFFRESVRQNYQDFNDSYFGRKFILDDGPMMISIPNSSVDDAGSFKPISV
ncbi:MAG: hypothetical protein ACE365_02735 [Gammaproteobacteria bacterium]